MNISDNNLFFYATSELSQDAFICWLSSWALEGAKPDQALQECARKMLEMFVPELAGQPFALTGIRRQWEHMDVLLTVKTDGKIYKIVVEDKTGTREHGSQLKNYLDALSGEFPDCEPRGVYFKTGFQCDLSQVEAAGYEIVMRSRILELMSPYAEQTDNQIFLDYYEYWNGWHQEFLRYKTLPPAQWEPFHIPAFYDDLKQSGFDGELGAWLGYGYVANPSGGFYGLWLGTDEGKVEILGVPCELYLQVEPKWAAGKGRQYPICLKISRQDELPPGISPRDVRNAVAYGQDGKYRLSDYGFGKPKRYGSGKHMTIGEFIPDCENAEQLKNAIADIFEDYRRLINDLRGDFPC